MTNIILTGDVMLGRNVSNVKNPFIKIASLLKGDVVFGNLECPITDSTEVIEGKKYIFRRIDSDSVKDLVFAGYNVMSLANNHIIDHKEQGMKDTMRALEKNRIAYVGLNNDLVMIKGVGFLAYCKPKNFFKRFNIKVNAIHDDIASDIKKAKQMVGFLVVSLHWGDEYLDKPSDEQRRLARSLIDNGANIVVGHHSHVVQEIEKYNNGLIAYSLGNFVFDQMFDEKVRKGIILKVDSSTMDYEVVNTYINDDFIVEKLK